MDRTPSDLVGEELQGKLRRRKQIADRHVFVRHGSARNMAQQEMELEPTYVASTPELEGTHSEMRLDLRAIELDHITEAARASRALAVQREVLKHGTVAVTTLSSCSSHFSLSSPRGSPFASLGENNRQSCLGLGCSDATVSTSCGTSITDLESACDDEDDHTEEEVDLLQYEWQFEILNSLPHARAVALVAHLRSVELEKVKTGKSTLQLQKSNADLRRRLDTAEALLRGRGVDCVAKIEATHDEDVADSEDDVVDDEAEHVADSRANGCRIGRIVGSCFKVVGILLGAAALSSSLNLAPETFGVSIVSDNSPTIEVWQLEQLERLQEDVQNALHNGQNTVCWRV